MNIQTAKLSIPFDRAFLHMNLVLSMYVYSYLENRYSRCRSPATGYSKLATDNF